MKLENTKIENELLNSFAFAVLAIKKLFWSSISNIISILASSFFQLIPTSCRVGCFVLWASHYDS